MEKLFHLKENNTDVKTEIIAGITTFMAMAYILAVNPDILSSTGMDKGAVFTATALASFIGTLLMALLANYPFALAPGMGLNAYFAYTVVLDMGYSWQTALTAVFVEGIIFIILSMTNIRSAIFNSIPLSLKTAVSVGIGLYIAFIGLQNCNLVVGNNSTLLGLFSLSSFNEASEIAGTQSDVGITVLLAVIGTIITFILVVKKVKANILLGILITWFLGIICQLTGLYVPNGELGFYSLLPDFSGGFLPHSFAPVFCKFDFTLFRSTETIFNFLVVIFAFLFVDLFDTIGTLIGVSSKAGMLDKNGRLPKIKGAMLADAIGTTAGAILGTSTVSTYIESSTGVAEGGRTGLTSLTTAVMFALSLLLSPIFLAIPSFATAPALIVVGFYMVTNIVSINFENTYEAIPAYICMLSMPLFYSISEGISMGIISYVALHIVNPDKNKKMSALMYVLAVLFILKYILL